MFAVSWNRTDKREPQLTVITVLDTLQVYWSVVEAGISILAVNLPSIWLYLFRALPEQLVASIRSVISLASIRTSGSGGSRSQTRLPSRSQPSVHSGSSQVKFASADSAEAFAEHDVEAQNQHNTAPGGITITSTVRQDFVN